MLISAHSKRYIFRRFASFAWFALVLLLASISNAEHLPIKIYTIGDGLAHNRVQTMFQDAKGFLLAACEIRIF